jgi:hypothetical protein
MTLLQGAGSDAAKTVAQEADKIVSQEIPADIAQLSQAAKQVLDHFLEGLKALLSGVEGKELVISLRDKAK